LKLVRVVSGFRKIPLKRIYHRGDFQVESRPGRSL
jgi:hypothetical protein